MRHFVIALAVFLLTSCIVVPKEKEETLEDVLNTSQADCTKVLTPKRVSDYYLCRGPMSYCWLAEAGGISCIPRVPD